LRALIRSGPQRPKNESYESAVVAQFAHSGELIMTGCGITRLSKIAHM
jgi:hypothetical protein